VFLGVVNKRQIWLIRGLDYTEIEYKLYAIREFEGVFARNGEHKPVVGLLYDHNCSNKASKLDPNKRK
jgi:hypothetical protein